MGNSIVHVLLVAYMLSNSDNQSEYWVKERKLGGIEGPVFLALLFAAGYFALQGWRMTFSIWNLRNIAFLQRALGYTTR